ncbi:related to branched-chain alpha-ketoacid dehydrogenase kinase, mitochondrial precursor [Armillaria ostoyae]|uniref:Protein-serine/threonine kinase n=1 Tax=Armillaria ostoyae TaxID=47428 RepID=A0A284R6W4_ARMOS|nr:related to branched-chain alpha-ketoacid dehydrogenase kinase, mitochondrial precursor [Armillaria ostoyae]
MTSRAFKYPPLRQCQRYYRRAPPASSAEISQLLDRYDAASPPPPLNLSQLISFGRPLTSESVLQSSQFVLSNIPRGLAFRIHSLETLPFIVGTNPFIANTLNAHRESFQFLANYPIPRTIEDNAVLAEELKMLVESHANDIPTMAKGFQECSRYLSPTQVSHFLDGAIRNRISVRLMAEQHIALSDALKSQNHTSQVGVIDGKCSPADMIRSCGSFVKELCEATLGSSPTISINGVVDATFPYVPVHLEYILTEILKNSFRATVEHYSRQSQSSKALPPVVITLSPPPAAPAPGPKYFSLRIRDQGGGISPTNMLRIFSYAFTTAGRNADEDDSGGGPYAAQYIGGSAAIGDSNGEGSLFGEITKKGLQTGMGTIAGLGYGLPMSKLYAKYFGGTLDLKSLEGWGSDVFLKLRCLDESI